MATGCGPLPDGTRSSPNCNSPRLYAIRVPGGAGGPSGVLWAATAAIGLDVAFICMYLSLVFHSGRTPSASLPSMPSSVSVSCQPCANIWSAVLKLDAVGFATRAKTHYIPIDHANIFQI